MEGEVISTRIKPTETTTLAKLTIGDQLKLLISKVSNEDAAELDAAEKLSTIAMRERASLSRLIKTAASGLESGEHTSVTVSLSSKYIPYLETMLDKKRGLGRYYDFEYNLKDLPITVEYQFPIRITRKVSGYTGGER